MRYAGDRLIVERHRGGPRSLWIYYEEGARTRLGSRTRVALFLDSGFVGLRLGRRYLKLRDVRRHPLLFSERNRYGYRPLLRVGEHWELGIK